MFFFNLRISIYHVILFHKTLQKFNFCTLIVFNHFTLSYKLSNSTISPVFISLHSIYILSPSTLAIFNTSKLLQFLTLLLDQALLIILFFIRKSFPNLCLAKFSFVMYHYYVWIKLKLSASLFKIGNLFYLVDLFSPF